MSRDLDAQVAEKIMGLTVIHDWPCGCMPDGCDLEAAWPEVDEVKYLPILPLHPQLYGLDHYPERHPVTPEGNGVRPVKFYSTKWSAMQAVVERMATLGWVVVMGIGNGKAYVCIAHGKDGEEGDNFKVNGSTDTLPHAVCLAALTALGR